MDGGGEEAEITGVEEIVGSGGHIFCGPVGVEGREGGRRNGGDDGV